MKKIIIWSSAVLGVLLVAMIVHIYIVTEEINQDQRVRALARIDFNQEVDSLEAGKIQGMVQQLEGIESTYFNVPDNILVYSYFNQKLDKQTVYETITKAGYSAKPFVVDATKGISGCPVMGSKGFLYRATIYFLNLKRELSNNA